MCEGGVFFMAYLDTLLLGMVFLPNVKHFDLYLLKYIFYIIMFLLNSRNQLYKR